MTKEELMILKECKPHSQPPRARLWAWYELSKRWRPNDREGREGYYNHVDVTMYLEENWEKNEKFLEENNLEKFQYDKYFNLPEKKKLDNRTHW